MNAVYLLTGIILFAVFKENAAVGKYCNQTETHIDWTGKFCPGGCCGQIVDSTCCPDERRGSTIFSIVGAIMIMAVFVMPCVIMLLMCCCEYTCKHLPTGNTELVCCRSVPHCCRSVPHCCRSVPHCCCCTWINKDSDSAEIGHTMDILWTVPERGIPWLWTEMDEIRTPPTEDITEIESNRRGLSSHYRIHNANRRRYSLPSSRPVAIAVPSAPPAEQSQLSAPPTERPQPSAPPIERSQPAGPPTERSQPSAPPAEPFLSFSTQDESLDSEAHRMPSYVFPPPTYDEALEMPQSSTVDDPNNHPRNDDVGSGLPTYEQARSLAWIDISVSIV